jgi:hypothetical protein
MQNLNQLRGQLDMLLSASAIHAEAILNDPNNALHFLGIENEGDSVPLYAWNPTPSAITACVTCLFKGPTANPRTSADCPPRPQPTPTPTPKK